MNAARFAIVACSIALLGGCATNPNDKRPDPDALDAPRAYAPRAAAALAFDPPAALAGPAVPLDREGRAIEAFAGYEQQVTTYSYVHQRDEIRQIGPYGQLERQAYTDRLSVTTR